MSEKVADKNQDRLRIIAGVAGLIIVLGFAAACAYVDRSRGSSPARVVVVSITKDTLDARAAFLVEIKNAGDHTAEQVVLRGELGDADPVDHEVDFLAPGESEAVTFTAPRDLKKSDVKASVLAWVESE